VSETNSQQLAAAIAADGLTRPAAQPPTAARATGNPANRDVVRGGPRSMSNTNGQPVLPNAVNGLAQSEGDGMRQTSHLVLSDPGAPPRLFTDTIHCPTMVNGELHHNAVWTVTAPAGWVQACVYPPPGKEFWGELNHSGVRDVPIECVWPSPENNQLYRP
jgi:hypothetical protein